MLFLNVAPENESLNDTELSMSFSQDAKRVINQPFDNVTYEKVDKGIQEQAPGVLPVYNTASPLAKTPMREVNNLRPCWMQNWEKRRRNLQDEGSRSPHTTSSPSLPKSRKLSEISNESQILDPESSKNCTLVNGKSGELSTVSLTDASMSLIPIHDGKAEFINEVNSLDNPSVLAGISAKLAKDICTHRPFASFDEFVGAVGESRARQIYKKY